MSNSKIKNTDNQKGIRVLIAEDDKISLRILEKNLRNWDYEVVTTSSGREALGILRNSKTHMAVLDWIMPELSGPEICEKVRLEKKDRYTYLILLTAKNNPEDIIQGLTAGADDYVTKPFNLPELKARLQTGERIIVLESQLLETQKKLHEMVTRDVLTNLWSRREILQILDEEVVRSSRQKLPLGTIMIDIDNFKMVNDSHGHQIGDSVLAEIASRLAQNVRPYDKVGRYGGDEMLIVLPNCHLADLEPISKRLQSCIDRSKFKIPQTDIRITISIGAASSETMDKISSEILIFESDKALLSAKRLGRNCYIIAS